MPRNYKFDDWIVSEPSLRVKIALPFMHKAPPTETTECLSLIESHSFINTDYISWMYGGAILANKKGFQTLWQMEQQSNRSVQLIVDRG